MENGGTTTPPEGLGSALAKSWSVDECIAQLHAASQGFETVCLLIGLVVPRPTQLEGKDAAGDVHSSVPRESRESLPC